MVMHSWERTTADGSLRAPRIAVVARLFPVASTPWMQRVVGLGYSGFLGSELADMGAGELTFSRQVSCWTWISLHRIDWLSKSESSSSSKDTMFGEAVYH